MLKRDLRRSTPSLRGRIDTARSWVLSKAMRVLLVEDDPMIGRAVKAGLHDAGYAVDWVRDGAEAQLAVGTGVYDLALLDLGLPRHDGLDLLKGVRRSGDKLPILIITARDSVADRIFGLD